MTLFVLFKNQKPKKINKKPHEKPYYVLHWKTTFPNCTCNLKQTKINKNRVIMNYYIDISCIPNIMNKVNNEDIPWDTWKLIGEFKKIDEQKKMTIAITMINSDIQSLLFICLIWMKKRRRRKNKQTKEIQNIEKIMLWKLQWNE